MNRVGLKQEFHGEPDPNQEGERARSDKDEAKVEVRGGTISIRVPSALPDDQVIQDKNFNGFVDVQLMLEDGQVLSLQVSEGAQGVDARLLPGDKPQTG